MLALVQTIPGRSEEANAELAEYLNFICTWDKLGSVVASAAVSVVLSNFTKFEPIFDVADP